MRSIENVRGEWDELGERHVRVVVPGPGLGDVPGEAPGEVPPATEAGGAGLPGPGREPDPAPERVREPAGAAGDGASAVTHVPPAADVLAVVSAPPAPHTPAAVRESPHEASVVRASSAVRASAGVEDEHVPADPEPALDAVAGAGGVAPVDCAVVPAAPDPGPCPEPAHTPSSPAQALEPVPGLLPAPAPAPDAVSGVEEEAGPAAAERGRGPKGAAPDLREPVSGGTRVPDAPDDKQHAPVTLAVGAADPADWWGAGRRRPVISAESTAPVPLLFREDGDGSRPVGTGDGTGSTAAGAGVARRHGDRRPPQPRSPQGQRSGRPAPFADPRLLERPGPALPGWAALFTAAAGTAAGVAVLWWQGALPAAVTGRIGLAARPYDGVGAGAWALLALLAAVVLFALHGLGRGRAGHASVLTLFGDYRGSVRRTGLLWISPLLRRRRVDVRLRHWRSEPMPAVDASGTALRAVVLVVWRVKDTARAALGVADHESYLRDQVEAALARVLSQLPADAFHEDTRTLRDAEAVGDALTRMVRADCVSVGIEVYSAQPTGIEYAPEVAAAMQRCRVAAIDAKHRDEVLTSVVDAVDDTVGRLTARGIVELDDYEHKALVRDLTVAFYTGRGGREGA
ncbi:SPFH domain-containing protein [Streptomyces atroolivaceus]|uniref:SPFH domain-containing protein n=1 Tax=Streptomyces atroolivaceus TaxID=66869 RepID=UPI00341FAC25